MRVEGSKDGLTRLFCDCGKLITCIASNNKLEVEDGWGSFLLVIPFQFNCSCGKSGVWLGATRNVSLSFELYNIAREFQEFCMGLGIFPVEGEDMDSVRFDKQMQLTRIEDGIRLYRNKWLANKGEEDKVRWKSLVGLLAAIDRKG